MRNLFVLTAAAAVLFGAAVAGRLNESPLQTAALDWERGDYISALDTYLRVLDSSTSPADLDAIALQTGELYRTTELTTDGALPRFSPDGRTLLYESGLGLARLTRLLPANGLTVAITELHGFGAVYSPDGTRIAYLAVRATPELTNAEAAIEQGPSADRPGVRPLSTSSSRRRQGLSSATSTPDANRKCHCPGSARPSWRMERGACGSREKGRATRRFRSTKRRTTGAPRKGRPGPRTS